MDAYDLDVIDEIEPENKSKTEEVNKPDKKKADIEKD